MKLGHVHLKVRDLERSRTFYQQLLGLQETELVHDLFSFLSFGSGHHDVALQALGEFAATPVPGSVGLYHVAFEVLSEEELREVQGRLRKAQVPYSAIDHGISWALYFTDPDGNGVEVYLDRRSAPEGRIRWGGASGRLHSLQ